MYKDPEYRGYKVNANISIDVIYQQKLLSS